MKKIAVLFVFTFLLSICGGMTFAKEVNTTRIFLNNKDTKIVSVVKKGQNLVAVRSIFNAMGVKFKVYPELDMLFAVKDDKVILMRLSSNEAIVFYEVNAKESVEKLESNKKNKEFKTSNINGSLYVSIRTLTEMLGQSLKNDSSKRIINVNTNKKSEDAANTKEIFNSLTIQIDEIVLKSKVQSDVIYAQIIQTCLIRAIADGKIGLPENEISAMVQAKSKSFVINKVDLVKSKYITAVPDVVGLSGDNRGWRVTITKDGSVTVEVVDDIKAPKNVVKMFPKPEKWDIAPYNILNESQTNNKNTQNTQKTEIDLSKEKSMELNIKTDKGDIGIVVYPELMPITAENFTTLADQGFYNNLLFHRVEDWVIQGGDPKGDGTGGSDKTIKLETNPKLLNLRGALAMARSSDPDSATSQFYILKKDASWLDGQYAVFGKVVSGMDIVDKIEIGVKILSIEKVTKTEN